MVSITSFLINNIDESLYSLILIIYIFGLLTIIEGSVEQSDKNCFNLFDKSTVDEILNQDWL